jgi:formate dehydrogenase (NADP+) alpha subunit
MTREKTLNITIDNKKVKAQQNQTILQAARQNGFYIPSLCALEHLPSYGACRLCIVEVDGIRGYPTACTTPIEEGMTIRTDTAELRTLRQEVLKLLLSEHPASCLFCTEQVECKEYQGTIRKVGVITGCRYCPNDSRCELQQITETVGLTETSYPVYYRGFPVEKFDPFYDRDYNLCILCGRCVRVCNEIRLNGTLSFKQRGKQTTIGPAFERSHVEAGCEFCGACVSVCPTGALSVKTSKWYGRPDKTVATSCVYCPIGCRLVLQVRNGEVIDVLPDYDSPIDHGLLCVKGRFGVPEYVHNAGRLTTPRKMTPIGYEDIDWNQALSVAAERLAGIDGDDFLMIVSADLSNEDLFAAQAFTRKIMHSANIVSGVGADLGNDLVPFANLALQSASFQVLDAAEAILAIGFDATYGFSPLGVAVKKAVTRGAALATIGADDSNLDMYASVSWHADGSKWAQIVAGIADGISQGEGKKKTVKEGSRKSFPAGEGDWDGFKDLFRSSTRGVLIVGAEALAVKGRGDLLTGIALLRNTLGWKTIVAHPYTNLGGLLAMGAMAGLAPGEVLSAGDNGKPVVMQSDATQAFSKKRRKVVYMIGEVPSGSAPPCDFLIYQNGLPPPPDREADLVLPASIFAESAGTIVNFEGKILELKKAVEAPGTARPDWLILNDLGEMIKKGGLKFPSLASIQKEIKGFLQGFPSLKKALKFVQLAAKDDGLSKAKSAKVTVAPMRVRHRGVALSSVVAGIKTIEERRGGRTSSRKEQV